MEVKFQQHKRFAGVILGLVLLLLGIGGDKLKSSNSISAPKENSDQKEQTLDLAAKSIEAPLNEKGDAESPQTFYSVVSVPDGDTIRVQIENEEVKVRLIGINTPELEGATGAVSCFGQRAAEKARAALNDKKVRLESDPSQNDRDKFDRRLRYAFLEDGTNFGEMMIREGFAYEYTYNTPYKFQQEFKAAQTEARQNQKGLWAPNACGAPAAASEVAAPEANTPAANPTVVAALKESDSRPDTTSVPVTTADKFYTSSRSNAKYYYPSTCDEWKDLSPTYIRSFNSVSELLAEFPTRKPSPKCQ